jgi:hypothetical protein
VARRSYRQKIARISASALITTAPISNIFGTAVFSITRTFPNPGERRRAANRALRYAGLTTLLAELPGSVLL